MRKRKNIEKMTLGEPMSLDGGHAEMPDLPSMQPSCCNSFNKGLADSEKG
jgi:hypothetical protein